MAVTLDRAVEASEIVDALKPFGVTQVDVAAVIQVSDRAVRGWRTGDIRPERYDRLAQLRDLVLLLSDSLTPRGVGQWLHAKNRLLDGQRPVDLAVTTERASRESGTHRTKSKVHGRSCSATSSMTGSIHSRSVAASVEWRSHSRYSTSQTRGLDPI